MGYWLLAQPGYRWALDLTIAHALGDDGLTVSVDAVNLGATPAPLAYGAHPYLTSGSDRVDDDVLTLPGDVRLLTDTKRKLPTGREAVDGSAYDFRTGRPIGGLVLDDAFTRSDRSAGVTLRSPAGTGVELWADASFGWFWPTPPTTRRPWPAGPSPSSR